MFQIEVLYNGTWHHFESENVEITAYRVARDVRRNLKLSARDMRRGRPRREDFVMISRFLSAHVAPALFGAGVGITLIHYVFDRTPYISVGAGLALVVAGFLLWAVCSEEE